jgi:hypothetical protein
LCGSHAFSIAADIPKEGNYAVAYPHLNSRHLQPAIGTNPVFYFRCDPCIFFRNEMGFAAESGMERI